MNKGPRNTIIVKYSSSGVAQWAIPNKNNSDAQFNGVAVDRCGKAYAVGVLKVISDPVDFGGKSFSFNGPSSNLEENAIIVKYY